MFGHITSVNFKGKMKDIGSQSLDTEVGVGVYAECKLRKVGDFGKHSSRVPEFGVQWLNHHDTIKVQ